MLPLALTAVLWPWAAVAFPQARGPEKAPGAASTAEPSLVIDSPFVSFGDVHQGATVAHRYTFSNRGTRPVRIEEGIALSGTGTVEFNPALVPAGGQGEVRVRQPVEDRLGEAAFRFALVTDEPGVSRYRMGLSGFVESAYEPENAAVDLGMVDPATGRAVEMEFASREVARLEVASISGAPAFLDVSAKERAGLVSEAVRLRVSLKPGAPLGLQAGTFRIQTNVPSQPECAVSYRANVFGDAVPSEHPVRLGLARVGEELSKEIVLTSRSGAPLEVERVDGAGEGVSVSVLPCTGEKAGPSCVRLRWAAHAKEKTTLGGIVSVRLKGTPEPVPLRYQGWFVSASTPIKDVVIPAAPSTEESAPSPRPGDRTLPPPAPAAETAPSAAGAAPTPTQVTLEWRAAREERVYGYLVYRCESREGPFRRVSDAILRVPEESPDGTHAYRFVDRGVAAGRTYYYYLDTVSTGGIKQRFSTVLSKTVATGAGR